MKTKIALITGSSKGIGKAIADRLEKEEYTIIHNDSSKADLSTKGPGIRYAITQPDVEHVYED